MRLKLSLNVGRTLAILSGSAAVPGCVPIIPGCVPIIPGFLRQTPRRERERARRGLMSREQRVKSDKRAAFRNCGASSPTSVPLFRIAERYVGGSGPLLRNAARQMSKAGRLSRLRRIKWEKRHVCNDWGDVRSRSRLFGCVCRLTWFSWPHFLEKSGIDT